VREQLCRAPLGRLQSDGGGAPTAHGGPSPLLAAVPLPQPVLHFTEPAPPASTLQVSSAKLMQSNPCPGFAAYTCLLARIPAFYIGPASVLAALADDALHLVNYDACLRHAGGPNREAMRGAETRRYGVEGALRIRRSSPGLHRLSQLVLHNRHRCGNDQSRIAAEHGLWLVQHLHMALSSLSAAACLIVGAREAPGGCAACRELPCLRQNILARKYGLSMILRGSAPPQGGLGPRSFRRLHLLAGSPCCVEA